MLVWLKNWLTGKDFLNNSKIKKEAKVDASEGLVLDASTPSIFEQKLIDTYENKLLSYQAKTSDKLYAILKTKNEKDIASFISKCAHKEDFIIKQAQIASNSYRREHFKILRDENNPALTLDINHFFKRCYKVPKGIKSLDDYKAALQAQDDILLLDKKNANLETLHESFCTKSLQQAQIQIIENYETSNKIPNIIQDYLEDKIEKAQLHNEIKELKAKEQKLLNSLLNPLFIYNSCLQELVSDTQQNKIVAIKDIRRQLRLYYDVPLNIESVEEYSVLEKAQSDVNESIHLFYLNGALSPYEYYLRDVYQEKIEVYYEAHGLQYRHMQDEEQLLMDIQENESVTHNYHNPLIVQRGISFENKLENQFMKLISLYRLEYLRLYANKENLSELKENIPFVPTLTYHFRNIEDETLTVEMIKKSATKDASILQNDLNHPSAFMYSIQKKYQGLIEKNHKSYESLCADKTKELDTTLLSKHLEEESILLNQYKEFQLIYIREFINRKQVQSIEKVDIILEDNDSELNFIPELQLYFDNPSKRAIAVSEALITQWAQDDVTNEIIQKVYPDFSYSEKKICNAYQQLLAKEYSKDSKEEMDSAYKLILSQYRASIDLYRETYLSLSDNSQLQKKLFIFGYMPIDNIKKLNCLERAIIDANTKMEQSVFIKELMEETKVSLELNYKSFLTQADSIIDLSTGVHLDDSESSIYKEFSSEEQTIILEMKQNIQYYQNQFTLFSKAVNEDYVLNNENEIPRYIELYFDNEITNEKTAQQAKLDMQAGIIKAPSSYQNMITAYYQHKMHTLKKNYLDQVKSAKDDYINTGNNALLTNLRAQEQLDKEQIVNKYNAMMQHYKSCNTMIENYEIQSLV